jgi:hypothetical protein
MSTIAPDQLPTPTTTPTAPLPPAPTWGPTPTSPATPASPAGPASRSTSRRNILGAVAAVVVAAGLGAAAIGLGGGGEASARETDRRSQSDARDEGTEVANNPDDLGTSSAGSDTPAVTDTPATPSAGNASIDIVGSYQAMFGVTPSASTLECVQTGVSSVAAQVQAVVDGAAVSTADVAAAMTPFAECAPAQDFSGMVLTLGMQVVQPSSLDQQCALSVIDTFTATDRLSVLVESYMTPDQFVQKLYTTFAPCSF